VLSLIGRPFHVIAIDPKGAKEGGTRQVCDLQCVVTVLIIARLV
jgi:hypothetical protein